MSSVSKVTANKPARTTARAGGSAAAEIQDAAGNGQRTEGISIGVILGFVVGGSLAAWLGWFLTKYRR